MGVKVYNTIWTPKSQQILNALNVFCNIEHHSVKRERTLFEHQVLNGFNRKNTNWSLGTERSDMEPSSVILSQTKYKKTSFIITVALK